MNAWPFTEGDRVADKATGRFTGTVTAREDGGTYTVLFDDGKIEHGCRPRKMKKIK